MRFDINFLRQFCTENKLIIDDIGENVVVNRELRINGLCLKCTCPFTKTFRMIVKNGALCEECMKNKASTLIKQSLITFDTTRLDKFCQENDVEANYDKSQTLNQLTIISGPCKTTDCNFFYSKPFRQLVKIGAFCEKCSLDRGKEKIKATTLKNHGVTSVLKSNEFRERIKEETFKKHGVEYLAQTQEVKNKVIATNMLKYGCKSPLQVKEVREKGIKTNIIKYGQSNPAQNENVKRKIADTNLEVYGKKCFFETEQFKLLSKQTNIKKYGVEHGMQSAEVSSKAVLFSKKKYKMPTGCVINYQGYENFAFDKLLKDGYKEDDIITSRKDVPEIWYFGENNKKRRHFVDIFLPSINKCIEIKSEWTMKLNEEDNLKKQNAAKQLGYLYEIWIFNQNGDLVQCLN